MKKRAAADHIQLESMTRELEALRAELEQARRKVDANEHVDAVADALIGEFDPQAVLSRAERWATAALGRPCSIVLSPGEAGAIPLGSNPGIAWLVVDGASSGRDDDPAARAVAIVKAAKNFENPAKLLEASRALGEAMPGLDISKMEQSELMQTRGW